MHNVSGGGILRFDREGATMQEEWRPVAGWEDLYEVSSLGRVRSLDREGFTRGDSKRLYKGRVLKPYPMVRSGYLSVRLSQAGHPKKLKKVHRLVAEAFIPNPEGHPLVRHLNDQKEDNRRENLAWGTAKDNNQDRFRNGYKPHRSSHCKRGHAVWRQ